MNESLRAYCHFNAILFSQPQLHRHLSVSARHGRDQGQDGEAVSRDRDRQQQSQQVRGRARGLSQGGREDRDAAGHRDQEIPEHGEQLRRGGGGPLQRHHQARGKGEGCCQRRGRRRQLVASHPAAGG